MCRSIKPLYNYDPPATKEEIAVAALQYVRKISGFTKPSHVNEIAFFDAVNEITKISKHLLESLTTTAEPRDREEEERKKRLKYIERFGNVNNV